MISLYILLFFLLAAGLRYNKRGFNPEYISKNQCNAIKGFCIVLVFIRHIIPYLVECGLDLNSFSDKIVRSIDAATMQLLVVPFLFYSGYGVAESIKRKGQTYVNNMPKKRIIITLLNFDIAVAVYLIMDLLIDKPLSFSKTILAFIGWTSIGNSNWYIFVIIMCYIVVFVSFRNNIQNKRMGGAILVALFMLFIGIMILMKKGAWWYDTILCFPLGLTFSFYREQIECVLKDKYKLSCFVLIPIFLVFWALSYINYLAMYPVYHMVCSLCLCFLILLATLKITINNKVLIWMGDNLFPLYIYQRLPMIVLATCCKDFVFSHSYLFILSSMVATGFAAYMFRYIRIKL